MKQTYFILFLFFCLFGQTAFSQDYKQHSIVLAKSSLDYLYQDCENKLEIIVPEIEGDYDGLLVVSSDAKVERDKKIPYLFSIYPKKTAEKIHLELYFYGDKIKTKSFNVKPFPTPKLVLYSHNENRIINGSLHSFPSKVQIKFSLGEYEDMVLAHENKCKTSFFEIRLYRDGKVIYSTKTKESYFSSETTFAIWKLAKLGDYLVVEAIDVIRTSSDGKTHKIREIQPLKIRFK